jgi:hypothetical protein
MVTAGLRGEFSLRIGTHPTSKGIVLARKLAGMALFVRKLRGHMRSNRIGALIVALLGTSACARSQPVTSYATTALQATALGAPLYPGAQADEGGSFVTRRGNRIAEVAAFQTTDSFERVQAFYRDRLPAGSQIISASTANGLAATFNFGSRGGRVTVEVASSKPRETDIFVKRLR